MKLATYRDGSRDGQLVVVSRDLSQAHYANGIATRLQQVLDDWNFIAPQLETLTQTLNQGKARHAFAFDPARCLAPLPRPPLMLAGNAYAGLDALLQEREPAREPQLERGPGEALLGAAEALRLPAEALGLDFEPGLLALCGDLPQGVDGASALDGVRLLMLGSGWVLRQLEAAERAQGRGAWLSQLGCSLSPVAVTPDELGAAWRGGRLTGVLHSMWNGRRFAQLDLQDGQQFGLGELLAQAARLHGLPAGSVVGTGLIGNTQAPACLAHKRLLEGEGKAPTGFLQWGDSLRLDIRSAEGQSLFGAIDMDVVSPHEALPEDAAPGRDAALEDQEQLQP